jgi:hypothetical protein
MKKRSKPTKLNEATRQPRKWVCEDNATVDYLLEYAETIHHFTEEAKKSDVKGPYSAMPLDLLRQIIGEREASLKRLRDRLAEREQAEFDGQIQSFLSARFKWTPEKNN